MQTEWYEALAAICEPLKIDLAKMHEEIGAGFMEGCIGAGEGLEPADQLVLLKNFLRALALRQGRSVTFMPRWNEAADSQSIHLHVSLKDTRGHGSVPRSRPDARRQPDVPAFPGRVADLYRRHDPDLSADGQYLSPLCAGHLCPARPDLGLREPHDLFPARRP